MKLRPLLPHISCLASVCQPWAILRWLCIIFYHFWISIVICVNWNALHRYHFSHSDLNKHFIMGDDHTIFTIFYYWRSRDVILHFLRFVLDLSFLAYSWEGLSHIVTLGIEYPQYGFGYITIMNAFQINQCYICIFKHSFNQKHNEIDFDW